MKSAVVLLSGGMDSTTTAAIARQAGFDIHALSFRYGQRHAVELDAARAGWIESEDSVLVRNVTDHPITLTLISIEFVPAAGDLGTQCSGPCQAPPLFPTMKAGLD